MLVSPERKHLELILASVWLQLLLGQTLVSCLPNIRIQVNKDNLQSPPYLLEAIKQAGSLAQLQQQQQQQQQQHAIDSKIVHDSNNGKSASLVAAAAENNNYDAAQLEPSGGLSGQASSKFSVVKEETIEEMLDLDPESILKLSPESIISAVAPDDYTRIVDQQTAASGLSESESHHQHPDYASADHKQDGGGGVGGSGSGNEPSAHSPIRRAQLSVTSSHLKKPAGAPDESGDTIKGEGSAPTATAVQQQQTGPGTGAKSLVSPSVTIDEAPTSVAESLAMKKKLVASSISSSPPDVWLPSQVMGGDLSNLSSVPATVNKDYVNQPTRTRITLGGGYVRDRLPPASANVFKDESRPERLVAPLEKSRPKQQPQSGGEDQSADRVVEIPERIIVSVPSDSTMVAPKETEENAMAKVRETSFEANQTAAGLVGGTPDPRCPKRGSTTIEHPTWCDRYFYCENGLSVEQICPNGLLYGIRDTVKDHCIHRWRADCGEKTIPNPISSPGCRWQYGIFNVQGSPKCSPDYYECTAGQFEVKKCPLDGQVYDDRTKSCMFAEQVGCANEALADFQCPPDDQANTYWPFPRYFLNERALIHCVNDKPEIVRCTDGERVDPEHLHCVPLAKLQAKPANNNERKAREKKKATTN